MWAFGNGCKKKKRWDVDRGESFLGKKGRTNTGCCLTAVKAKDVVLTQAADIGGCRTQRRSCSRVKEENLSPLSDKELEGAACVDFFGGSFLFKQPSGLNTLASWNSIVQRAAAAQ